MRLTHLCKFGDNRKNREPMLKIRNKLFELENIEDKLGIDLITLFKALKNGVYVNGGKVDVLLFYDIDFFNKTSFQLHASNGINYYLKDYGKTWSLDEKGLL